MGSFLAWARIMFVRGGYFWRHKMKDFTLGGIYCKCSARMHCKGKPVRIYEYTRDKQKCPNCGRKRQVLVAKDAKVY